MNNPLILGKGGKIKTKGSDICKKNLDIDFERERSIGLGPTFGDDQTGTHTHRKLF